MTEEAFNRIEQEFGVKLPDWYRRQVLAYSVSETLFPIYHDEDKIVRINRELRREGWSLFDWPREFFAISESGCGDYYFIVPSTGDRRIFETNHECGPVPSLDKLDEMVTSETIEELLGELPDERRNPNDSAA
jgi:hypothetical protein